MLNFIPHTQRIVRDASGDSILQMQYSHEPLFTQGLVFPVTVSASRLREGDGEESTMLRGKTIMALLDTGCTVTSIDKRLAVELGLTVIGSSWTHTAGGQRKSENYLADISFPGNVLMPFSYQTVGSCELPYEANADIGDTSKFGMLIGRDMMARWHITWNGSISAVCISD